MKSRPLDRQGLDAGAAVDQRLEQRFRAALRQLEHPFVSVAPRIRWDRGPPHAVLLPSAQADNRLKPRARLVDATVERDPALGNDRNALAQALGVSDHVGREDDCRAGPGLAADQLLEPSLVDGV